MMRSLRIMKYFAGEELGAGCQFVWHVCCCAAGGSYRPRDPPPSSACM